MRSIRRLDACLVTLCWLLFGCPALPDGPRYLGAGHDTPQHGGTLTFWEENRVRTLDPHIAFDEVSGVLMQMLFDTLYKYEPDMKLVPELAAAMPEISEDGKTFRIRLREGVRFHHGRELRASDVVWTLERVLSPKLRSAGASYYTSIAGASEFRRGEAAHVRGLQVLGPYEVAIELTKPDQSFVHVLAMRFACPMAREMVEGEGRDPARRPSGTGPFRLVSWEAGVRIVLARNPTYHRKGLPYLDQIVIEEDVKKEPAFLRFRNGEVDLASRIGPADTSYLLNGAWKPYTARSPRADVYGIGMNVEMAPFDNVHVRRAVAFAIDRERWAKARNYNMRPTGQLLPPAIEGYDPNLPNRQYFDLARAKREMQLAGYPNGLPEPVTIWGTASETMRRYLALAQSDLEKIGIRLNLKLVSFPVYLQETGKPKTAQMLGLGWVMDYPDPSNFLDVLSSRTKAPQNSSNRAFYSDPALDALLERARVERDHTKRIAMYREANDFVAREAPWAFFCNQQTLQAWQPHVRNFRPHPAYWLRVNDVWLDLPKKRVAQVHSREAVAKRFAALVPFGAAL
jgi:ABC-type transport system substrate-binding protein